MKHWTARCGALLFAFIVSVSVAVAFQEPDQIPPDWLQLTSELMPPARYDHALVSAGEANRLVLFGGRGSGNLSDTWIYDIETNIWHEVTGSGPEARFGMGAAYDALRNQVLIFGGEGDDLYNDVWAFDVATEVWSKLETTGTAPGVRYGTSAVVDPINDTLIISHGFASGRYDDTFAFDLETNIWQDVTPETRPLKRCLHDATFDTLQGRMILFGGCSSGSGPCPQGDAWSFDPLAQTWTELITDGPRPSPRSNPALIADSEGHVWLFGGKASEGSSNELWSLDSQTGSWTLYTTTNAPSARSSHDAAWDAPGNRLFVFGGRDSTGAVSDLWVYQP